RGSTPPLAPPPAPAPAGCPPAPGRAAPRRPRWPLSPETPAARPGPGSGTGARSHTLADTPAALPPGSAGGRPDTRLRPATRGAAARSPDTVARGSVPGGRAGFP